MTGKGHRAPSSDPHPGCSAEARAQAVQEGLCPSHSCWSQATPQGTATQEALALSEENHFSWKHLARPSPEAQMDIYLTSQLKEQGSRGAGWLCISVGSGRLRVRLRSPKPHGCQQNIGVPSLQWEPQRPGQRPANSLGSRTLPALRCRSSRMGYGEPGLFRRHPPSSPVLLWLLLRPPWNKAPA